MPPIIRLPRLCASVLPAIKLYIRYNPACGARTCARYESMAKKSGRPDADNPEWTERDFRRARPASQVVPKEVVAAIRRYRGQRGSQRRPTKELISLRIDRDVAAAYRATGPGWQAKANEALRAYSRRVGFERRARQSGRERDQD